MQYNCCCCQAFDCDEELQKNLVRYAKNREVRLFISDLSLLQPVLPFNLEYHSAHHVLLAVVNGPSDAKRLHVSRSCCRSSQKLDSSRWLHTALWAALFATCHCARKNPRAGTLLVISDMHPSLCQLAPSDGAFYIYADVRDLTDHAGEFCKDMLQSTGDCS